MAKMWDEEININTNWNGDESTGGLPVKGSRVQEFLRKQLVQLNTATEGKFGAAKYEGGVIRFYDEEGGKELGSIKLTGTSYSITLDSNRGPNFNVLTSDTDAKITFTPSTTAIEMGQSQGVPFPEDYLFTMEVDSGSGYTDRTPADNAIRSGGSATVDIRNYIKTGSNRIRIIVTGATSQQTRTTVWTANLTTLSMTCNHTWERAWIQGQAYSINEIYFGGNVAKTLHVRIGDQEYTQKFSASQQYTSVAYEFVATDYFPGITGVVQVELWMTAEGVETQRVKFSLMCVKAADIATARLTVVNDLPAEAINYSSQTLFSMATYNRTKVSLGIVADLDGEVQVVVPVQEMSVQTQTRIPYTTTLTIDTEETDNLSLGITVDEVLYTLPINNSNAYIATPGAAFYMQPALRSNGTVDREEIRNTAPSATKATYAAEWTNMTWSESDGWTVDADGNKTLRIMAGSTVKVPDLIPLGTSSASSLTVEFMYQASAVADYDTPVLTMMDTDEYDEANSRGIMLFPTRLMVLSSNERAGVYQRIDLPEDKIIHTAIVMQRNYAGTGRNLCRIYINGRENVTFEYSGTSNFGTGCLRFGQASTDLELYMFRTYNKALEANDVFTNFLNAMIDTAESQRAGERADNNILDAGSISYDLVKRAGFNTLVYETDDRLPQLDNPDTSALRLNLHFEYNDHPEWNVVIKNIPCDGQGTTSMRYFRWNLRNKIKDAATEWEYPNYQGGKVEQGKVGYIAGYGLHPAVGTITAKKNVASSPQGHKMGACGFYNDCFIECEGTDMLANEDTRVATYQYPMLAFQLYSDGRYEYRGLYTVGPDKKDKNTFGYGATKDYPALMMLEGPNHSPLGTRFLVPWIDVEYDYANETLTFGGEEGWDADIVAGYSTDKAADAPAIFGLYEDEFKPAYEAIYFTSPYIASVAETGKTLEQINADINGFRAGKTRGWSNELLTLYTSDYSLVFYSNAQRQYVVLPKTSHDMLSYLGLEAGATTDDIVAARAAKFKTEVFRHVSLSEALFHYCFCELLAVTDNFAKNTYWRKMKRLIEGGKWGFNQDDLDTLLQNDNNGQDTKEYGCEVDDVNASNGAEIFQGQSSAFWTQLRLTCQDEIADKYKDLVAAMQTLAARYKVSGSTVHDTICNVISYYLHSNSSRYFPATAYNEDTVYSYLSVWQKDPDATYNSVPPLTQVHGDHLQTELAFIANRVNYIMSKYRLGGFTGSGDDGMGKLEFTPATSYTMTVTPAMDMYPRVSVGGSESGPSERTKAGEQYAMQLPASGNTTVYVKAVDLLSDIGDLSQLQLGSRGGSEEIPFSISGARLREIRCGADDPDAVKFNATSLKIAGRSIESIDLSNCGTVKGTLDLTSCSRLKELKLRGTSLASVLPPVGGRVTSLELPEKQGTLFLHTLNLLKQEGIVMPDLASIESLYLNGMDNMDPLQMLFSVLGTKDNVLKYITLVWNSVAEVSDGEQLLLLKKVADNVYNTETGEGYGRVDWNGSQVSNVGQTPDIQGRIHLEKAYQTLIDSISRTFPNISIEGVEEYYQWFEDATIRNAALHSTVATDPVLGIKAEDWKHNMNQTDLRNLVNNMTNAEQLAVTSWDELGEIEKVNNKSVQSGTYFLVNKLKNLEKLVFPNNTFGTWDIRNMPNTKEVVVGENTSTAYSYSSIIIFQNWTSLEHLDVKNMYNRILDSSYGINNLCNGCTNLKDFKADTICPNSYGGSINYLFYNCVNLESVEIEELKTSGLNYMFYNCSKLTADNCVIRSIDLSKVTNCSNLFNGCTAMTELPSWFKLEELPSGCDTEMMLTGSGVTEMGNLELNCKPTFIGALTKVGDIISKSYYTISSNGVEQNLKEVGNYSLPNTISTSGPLFSYTRGLRKIGNIDLPNLVSATGNFFVYATNSLTDIGYVNIPKLETNISIEQFNELTNFGGFRGLKVNCSLKKNIKLTPLSVHNIINEAAGGTVDAPITVSLHATALANWQESEYYEADAAMAEAKHIVIA